MKIIPRLHRINMIPVHRRDDEDWWSQVFNWGDGSLAGSSRLPELFRRGPSPALNVAETEDEYTVTLDLPGLDEDDIDVQLMGNHLVISGERKWEDEEKKKEFHRVESEYGTFSRTVVLPEGLTSDPESIKASYKRGLLEIRVPKVEPTPATKIKVKAD